MDTATPPLASIGIDIGKEVFHLVGFDTDGKIAFRRKIKRLALAEAFKTLPPASWAWRPASALILSVAFFASSAISLGSFRQST